MSSTTTPQPLAPGQWVSMTLDNLDERAVWSCRGATGWRFTVNTPGDTWPSGTVPVLTFETSDDPHGPYHAVGVTISAEGTTDSIWLQGLWNYISARVSTAGSSSACVARVTGQATVAPSSATTLG